MREMMGDRVHAISQTGGTIRMHVKAQPMGTKFYRTSSCSRYSRASLYCPSSAASDARKASPRAWRNCCVLYVYDGGG